jgi:hypothetical protein
MALAITEIFGYAPFDDSPAVKSIRKSEICPFVGTKCIKVFRDGGIINGTCTVKPPNSEEVICCPKRMYAEGFKIIKDVAAEVFGPNATLITPDAVKSTSGQSDRVVAFGGGWGKELRVPKSDGKKGGYSADWILVLLQQDDNVAEFVAVEVQSMDTTGSYQQAWCKLMGVPYSPTSGRKGKRDGSINWENVNKRIFPQLITKGLVFQREALCKKGLFFITPTPVYKRVVDRLGATPGGVSLQPSAITFRHYELGPAANQGEVKPLLYQGQYTTTVHHLRDAFFSTLNLPPQDSFTEKIRVALKPKNKRRAAKDNSREPLVSG